MPMSRSPSSQFGCSPQVGRPNGSATYWKRWKWISLPTRTKAQECSAQLKWNKEGERERGSQRKQERESARVKESEWPLGNEETRDRLAGLLVLVLAADQADSDSDFVCDQRCWFWAAPARLAIFMEFQGIIASCASLPLPLSLSSSLFLGRDVSINTLCFIFYLCVLAWTFIYIYNSFAWHFCFFLSCFLAFFLWTCFPFLVCRQVCRWENYKTLSTPTPNICTVSGFSRWRIKGCALECQAITVDLPPPSPHYLLSLPYIDWAQCQWLAGWKCEGNASVRAHCISLDSHGLTLSLSAHWQYLKEISQKVFKILLQP